MLDPSLRGFVDAADEAEAERCLAALIEEQAAPLVRRVAARKLGAGRASSLDDLEDIVADALLALVSRLQSLRTDPAADPIESFADYTAVVAHHAFAHFLRRKDPARSHLKNRLRYVLTRERRFALWPTADGLACGLAGWRPAPPSPDATTKLDHIAAEPERWLRWTRKRPASPDDVNAILGVLLPALGGPVDFDRLVGMIAALSPTGPLAGGGDPARIAALPDTVSLPVDVALDQRRLTARLWREVCGLPVRQRVALLLSLRDDRGGGLLPVLTLTGAASIRQIADALEIPALELAGLWNGLPLDDRTIAERLACSRQQVINLRGAARKRLANRLDESGDDGPRSRAAGNMRAVPASLEDKA